MDNWDPTTLRRCSVAFIWVEFAITSIIIYSQILHIQQTWETVPKLLREDPVFSLYDKPLLKLSKQKTLKKLILEIKLKLFEAAIWTALVGSDFIPFVWTELQLADSEYDFTPSFLDYEIRSSISFGFWVSIFELVVLELPANFFNHKQVVGFGYFCKPFRHWMRMRLDETLIRTFHNTLFRFLLAFFIQEYDERTSQHHTALRIAGLFVVHILVTLVHGYMVLRLEYRDRDTYIPMRDDKFGRNCAELCKTVGFPFKNVKIQMVPPETPLNAFCVTYFGLFTRITFLSSSIEGFETKHNSKGETILSSGLNLREFEGVLAHELGHWARYHVDIAVLIPTLLWGPLEFGMAFWLREKKIIYDAFHLAVKSEPYPILPGFFIARFILLRFLNNLENICTNITTRFTEKDADYYTIGLGKDRHLQEGLCKLKRVNAGYPSSSLIYTMFYEDHENLLDRIEYLNRERGR